MDRFKPIRVQRFLSIHSAIHNDVQLRRHLVSASVSRPARTRAFTIRREAVAIAQIR